MSFPRPKTYELIGAGVAGTGVIAGAILSNPAGVAELPTAFFAVISFAAGGGFVGHYIRKRADQRAAEILLRQLLWKNGCNMVSSPLEFMRTASVRVLAGQELTKEEINSGSAAEQGPARWTAELSEVAAVVAYALDPEDQARDIVSDPAQWVKIRKTAEWTLPLMDSCGIVHRFKWPAELQADPVSDAERDDGENAVGPETEG